MGRQGRLVWVLAVALAVVGASLWLWEPPAAPRPAGADTRVWSLERERVVGLSLTTSDATVALQRQGATWQITEPLVALADEREVDFLLIALSRAEWGEELDQGDLAAFGLAPAAVVITVSLDDGRVLTLSVGDEGPGGHSYAQLEDGRVVALPYSLADIVDADVFSLRDRGVLVFPVSEVGRVSVTTASGTLDVAGGGRSWWLSGFGRADPALVEGLIYDLRGLRFLAYADGVAPAGIASPLAHVEVTLADSTRSFDVGETGPMGTLVRRDDGVAGFVDPAELAMLGRGPLDLVLRQAFQFDRSLDDAVDVDLDGVSVRLSRDDAGWRSPDLDGGEVAALLDALQGGRAVFLRDASPPLARTRGAIVVTRGGHTTETTLGVSDDGSVVLACGSHATTMRLDDGGLAALRGALGDPMTRP